MHNKIVIGKGLANVQWNFHACLRLKKNTTHIFSWDSPIKPHILPVTMPSIFESVSKRIHFLIETGQWKDSSLSS